MDSPQQQQISSTTPTSAKQLLELSPSLILKNNNNDYLTKQQQHHHHHHNFDDLYATSTKQKVRQQQQQRQNNNNTSSRPNEYHSLADAQNARRNSNEKPILSTAATECCWTQQKNLTTYDNNHKRRSPQGINIENHDENLNNNFQFLTQHLQRRLVGFFYAYAIVIIILYLTYAAYCFYHQQTLLRLPQQQQQQQSSDLLAQQKFAAEPLEARESSQQQQQVDNNNKQSANNNEFELRIEQKMHLLERYLEVLALDLEETRARLREREKCACSIGCSFNKTQYHDQQVWHQNCDVCKCEAGKITCQARECPTTNKCLDLVQLPGQCCPKCMKKCRLNKSFIRHNTTFTPKDQPFKQCKCNDGLIKCEPINARAVKVVELNKTRNVVQQTIQSRNNSNNKTIEYLKSILGPQFVSQPPSIIASKKMSLN